MRVVGALAAATWCGTAAAQTSPGTAAAGDPFEVRGALYSGSAPAGFLTGDAWAQGAAHFGVLDDNGLPAQDAGGVVFRAARQVDPNWGNAGDALDDSLFAGSNKNLDLIGESDTPWEWGIGSGGPQKNDVTNTYFHTRVDPATGDRWVFVAAETRSINGDSHVDFEFNQAGVVQVGTGAGELIGLGPDGGRTVDDFMISIDFEQGGSAPLAMVRFWNGQEFVITSVPEAAYSAVNSGDIVHGADGTWKHFTDDGAPVDLLTHLQLVEGGANLTALGIQVDPCSTGATFMVKTRSSSSWTADLKDYTIVHFPLEAAPELQIAAPDRVCRGTSFSASVTEMTGLPNASFEWQLTGCGVILDGGTSTDLSVQADEACGCEIVLTAKVVGGECHSTAVAEARVMVSDDDPPALTAQPADMTVECDAVPEAALVDSTDTCSESVVSFAEAESPGDCEGDRTITRTWTATDACDNATSHDQLITVQDTTAPALSGVPEDVAAECDAVPAPAAVTAEDHCSIASVDLLEETVLGICVGRSTLTRTWTATDDCGNAVSDSHVIAMQDTTVPQLQGVPGDATVECDAIPDPPEVTASDNCSVPTVDLVEVVEPGLGAGKATITRTWTATDDCGNATSQSQTLEVLDTTAPAMQNLPPDLTVECDAVPEPANVTATDNCAMPMLEFSEQIEPGRCSAAYVITRTWTAVDESGNQVTHAQVIAVVDTQFPQLLGVPEDETAECDSLPEPAAVNATDNCSEPVVQFSELAEPGDCDGRSTVTRTWIVVDDCGNETAASQVITVVDTTLPELSGVPTNAVVECEDVPTPPLVNAADHCSEPTIRFAEQREGGSCADEYTITRTWTAADDCGNEATEGQLLSVVDTTAPAFSDDPQDLVAECDAVPAAVTLTASDNCDDQLVVLPAEQRADGDCPGRYTLNRSWSTSDDCANESIVTQTVSVDDTSAPTMELGPHDAQFICDGQPVAFVLTPDDNCVTAAIGVLDVTVITADSGVVVAIEPRADGSLRLAADGPAYVAGTFHATDVCGNVSGDVDYVLSAKQGKEACSQGFWKNHPERWGPTGFSPNDLFVDAFMIADLSSPEVPSSFDLQMDLFDASNLTGGSFDQALLQGTAALLNAAHPDVDFPTTVEAVRSAMQGAFAGTITFDQARARFNVWNAAERECGCSIE